VNIAVYCSSSNEIDPEFKAMAFGLGEWIAEEGHSLVFGGATGGLMDAVSEGAKSKNGHVIGVVPLAIINIGRKSSMCNDLIEVETISRRKDKMRELSDVFIVLPGGYGTLDEMFDVVTSAMIGEHEKPLIMINFNGFFNFLKMQIDKMKSEKCIGSHQKYEPWFAANVEDCIGIINNIHQLKKD